MIGSSIVLSAHFVVANGHVCDFVRDAWIIGFSTWKRDIVVISKIPSTIGGVLTEYSVGLMPR